LVTLAFSVVGTYIILKIVDWTVGLRITAQDEEMGLDLSQHNERAYS
jgi:Amt family ammonium transporter